MSRHVRGVLFVDYVRMVRSHRATDWSNYLLPSDLELLATRIDLAGWYPMDTFERLGLAILREVAKGDFEGVRMWGRLQVGSALAQVPALLAEGDPRDTIMRFGVMSSGFFDFPAFRVIAVLDDAATVGINYGMSILAEETACHQTLGFLEGLVERAGGVEVAGSFGARSWKGAERTLVELTWSERPASSRR